MKTKFSLYTVLFLTLLLVVVIATSTRAADDGPLFTRNLSDTPDTETGSAQMSVMSLYVQAQNTLKEFVEIEYLAGDCTNVDTAGCEVVNTMTEAKPLIATFNDGLVHDELDEVRAITSEGGTGDRDGYAALSLDDGATWKRTNLSNSADRSSFNLANGHEFPGDVFSMEHEVVGNRVAVAWVSRFCESGSPLYSWEDEEKEAMALAYGDVPYLLNEVDVIGEDEPYSMYMDDLFGVAGSQGSVDYTAQGFPEIGEIPYGCVWIARGTLEEDPDLAGIYEIEWRQAERLTAGRRDPNRIDITGTSDAGFVVSWQEDPDGLRPGKGLGPGEGWSGAIANSKTDIWYSYIGWDEFDDVCLDDVDTGYCTPGELEEFTLESKPKISVPFAVPVRLTDNNKCEDVESTVDKYQPYCFADFNENSTADLCEHSEEWPTPNGSNILNICFAEDGRPLTGRTASTRVRWAVKPYTQPDGNISAWVVLAEEKMKAMGTELDEEEDPIDIGKVVWYHTFDMFNPELVAQGLSITPPAIDHETGEFFDVYLDEWENEYRETEITRRFNLMVQGIGTTMDSPNQTSAILLYKEGILNQGGPADIFLRRVVLPVDFDPAIDNPFAYENVVCDPFDEDGTGDAGDWLYTDGSNPNYVRGLCAVQGLNMSGTTIVTCDDGSSGDTCVDSFPWDTEVDINGYPKVTEWIQTEENLSERSWANPYDVSKGHRGFIDGDYVMLMYATAPNWKANSIGNEAYNLYLRRSFDGGQTWTTLPANYTHVDGTTWTGEGTTSCEWYGWGSEEEYEVCVDYLAGEFEQARNASQLNGSRETILDPRYSPTGGVLKTDYTDLLCYDDAVGDWTNCNYDDPPYPEELRDPSALFVTYEVGDNTVVTEETGAVPMDMYYSRGTNFGDYWDEIEFTTSSGELVEQWDWLEHGDEISEEASVHSNPNGSKFYAVWSQELEIALDEFTNMDSEFRRVFYNLDSDVYPSATILYASTAVGYGDTVLLVGTARDHDSLGEGIVAYEWVSDIDGLLGTGNELSILADTLTPGIHQIGFRAQDNEGNWSGNRNRNMLVAETLHQVFIPVIND